MSFYKKVTKAYGILKLKEEYPRKDTFGRSSDLVGEGVGQLI